MEMRNRLRRVSRVSAELMEEYVLQFTRIGERYKTTTRTRSLPKFLYFVISIIFDPFSVESIIIWPGRNQQKVFLEFNNRR